MEDEKGAYDGVFRALLKAEDLLAFLSDSAIKERRYEDASVLMDLASNVKTASHRFATFLGRPTGPYGPTKIAPVPASGSSKNALRRRGLGSYPKFFRESESLVKVGWSKRLKAEYQHKSPFRVLALLQAALKKAGANRKRFTMESLLPMSDEAGSHVPTYQVYVSLAWLRSIGVVVQHGRSGYSIPYPDRVEAAVHQKWNGLAGPQEESMPKRGRA